LLTWIATIVGCTSILGDRSVPSSNPIDATGLGFIALGWFGVLADFWTFVFVAARRIPLPRNDVRAAGTYKPFVAILYTTCDDFDDEAALSCLNQAYPCYRMYILDDGVTREQRERVDAFAARHTDRVHVVRRADRRGFKGGNLNHALRSVAFEEVFALVDADESLPTDFLSTLVPRLMAHPCCGFVQANHRVDARRSTPFSADLGITVDLHWRWRQSIKNMYGFVPLLGHGALVKRSCWQQAIGFPELVSEDLAFALRARVEGWFGRFEQDVVCMEEYPRSLRAFRVRFMKWTLGTCQLLVSELPRFLACSRVSPIEKLDVLMSLSRMPVLAIGTFLFLIWCTWAARVSAITDMNSAFVLLHVHFSTIGFPLLLISLVACLGNLAFELWREPRKLLRLISLCTVVYGGTLALSIVGIAYYAVTRRTYFFVTGSSRPASVKVHPDSIWERVMEFLIILVVFHTALTLTSALTLACAISCTIHVLMHRANWPLKRGWRWLLHMPLLLVLIEIARVVFTIG
jgi:cellulose synthase/poly-beta-1,6-N-acetylglucosamine synthase-like glycosyltransferase